MKHKSKEQVENDIQNRHRLKAKKLLADEDYVKDMEEYESLGLWGGKRQAITDEKYRIMNTLPKELHTITSDSPYYNKILRWKELDLEENQFGFRRAEIRNKHKDKQPYPYTVNELKEIADGAGRFLLEEEKIVDIVRLREPKYKPIDPKTVSKEDLDYCPNHSEIVDDGYRDDEGYLYFKVKPDEPRIIIRHLIDALLNIYGDKEKKKSRFRKEQADALDIYKAWMESGLSARKGFPKIAKQFKIPESTVKTRWYKAYSIIFSKRYDSDKIKEQAKDKGTAELCAKCKDATCYKGGTVGDNDWIPCSEFLRFAGKGFQREKTMNHFIESKADCDEVLKWQEEQYSDDD